MKFLLERLVNIGKVMIAGFLEEDADTDVIRRLSLVLFISLLGSAVLIPLAAVAFAEGNSLLALLDVTLALILTFNLIHLRIYKKHLPIIYSGTFFTGLLFVFAFVTGGVGQSGFIWYFTFPLISCYLLGSRGAVVANGLLLIPALLVFFTPDLPPFFAAYSVDFKIRFLPAFFVIFAFAYLFERQRERSQHDLSLKNRDLQATVEELHRKEASLRESHLLLERRVRERTAALSSANEDLEGEIAERTQAEKALKESEKRYRTLIAQAGDSVFILDPSAEGGPVIVEANEQACFDHGYRMDELIGKPISELDDQKNAALIGERVNRLMAGKAVTFEATHQRKDGSTFPVEVSARLITLSDRPYIFALDRDITERKQAEKALRIAKEELERQNEELKKLDLMKDALISDVSHELKTPVAKHIMQMEILKRRLGEERGADLAAILQVMEASINRQQNVIHNILMMSRLESGPREYDRSSIRLDQLIEEIRADFDHLFSSAGITVDSRIEEAAVLANKDMLWHVYSNILNNAIKYRAREHPEITVELGRKGEHALVSISDNGIGMTDDEQERAFQRFYQASPAKEGIGLGLNISRMIVERFGGTIRVNSDGRGRGTAVVTELPLAP